MRFKRKVLKNGMRVITVPMHDNPTVTVLVLVEAGSKYETKNINGVSHFLEHMCFKGTAKRLKAIDISRTLDSIGSQYNAFTSYEFTGYYAKSNPRRLSKILDVVSDVYLNSTFPEGEVEKEKGVIIDEINMYEDLPYNDVNSVFMELLYGDQPAGWRITGSKENVRNIRREDIVQYRKNHYVARATTVIVSGHFDEKKIYAEISHRFKNIEEGEKSEKNKIIEQQTSPKILIKKKKTDQTHIVLGVRTYDTYNKKNAVLKVIGVLLGGGMSSRLFQKLRDEMGVGYYVHSSFDAFTDHGYLDISTGVDSKKAVLVVGAILKELKRLKTERILPAELQKAKDYIIGNMYLSLESSDSLAEFYGYQEVLKKKIRKPVDIVREIKKVTTGDIEKVAREIFTDDRLNLAMIGPYDSASEFRKIFTIE
ncbi:MAG TPA: pitrilysin family protein [Candidatus Paceibacterota bacterium]